MCGTYASTAHTTVKDAARVTEVPSARTSSGGTISSSIAGWRSEPYTFTANNTDVSNTITVTLDVLDKSRTRSGLQER